LPISRSTRAGIAESETNTIDRAVANLMFNKVHVNIQDHLPTVSAKFEHEGTTHATAYNYSSNEPDSFVVSKSMKLQADSEVPVFRQDDPNSPSSLPGCSAEDLF